MASLRAIAHQDFTDNTPYNEFEEFGQHIALQMQEKSLVDVRECRGAILTT